MTSTGSARSRDGAADPKVSVVMATFNCRQTVEEAVDSLRSQTYDNWELVVCDDGSTDGTFETLQAMSAELGDRLVLVRNAENMKLPFSLNRCLQLASGELIARMDGDDLCEPERFERQVRYLADHPGVQLVGTAMRRFDERGDRDVILPASLTPDRDTLGRGLSVPFFHATIVARREVFEAVGNYTVSWRTERGQDVDLWFKFFRAGFVGRNIPEPLYRVRENEHAIRRRTPKARVGGYVTRIIGYRSLGYPMGPYVRSTASLAKVLVPYRVYSLHRAFLTWRSSRREQPARDASPT